MHVHLPRCVDDGQRQGAGGELSAGPAKAVAGDLQPDDVVENPAADDASLKILFVEDDPTLRMLTGEVMMELGHQVVASETAEEALEALGQQPFDVLLTDVGLAGMSGIDLAREASARHPRLSLVIASGYAVNASDVGLDRLRTMLKPYDIHQVRELLDGIRAERAALRN